MEEVKELKFKVGDKVTAKLSIGKFKGKVVYVNINDLNNLPYLVQLKMENARFNEGRTFADRSYKRNRCYWCAESNLVARTRDTDFHVGDKVKIRSWKSMEKEFGLDFEGYVETPISFIKDMKYLCGSTATILSIEKGGNVSLQFDDDKLNTVAWVICVEMLKKVKGEKPEEPKLYNGKVVCLTDSGDTTMGKIYEVNKGIIVLDTRHAFPLINPIEDFNDLLEYFKGREDRTNERGGYFSDETIDFVGVVK